MRAALALALALVASPAAAIDLNVMMDYLMPRTLTCDGERANAVRMIQGMPDVGLYDNRWHATSMKAMEKGWKIGQSGECSFTDYAFLTTAYGWVRGTAISLEVSSVTDQDVVAWLRKIGAQP